MVAKISKIDVGCNYATMKVSAVTVSLKKENQFGGVNYKVDFFEFFPFSWFAFWRLQKILGQNNC